MNSFGHDRRIRRSDITALKNQTTIRFFHTKLGLQERKRTIHQQLRYLIQRLSALQSLLFLLGNSNQASLPHLAAGAALLCVFWVSTSVIVSTKLPISLLEPSSDSICVCTHSRQTAVIWLKRQQEIVLQQNVVPFTHKRLYYSCRMWEHLHTAAILIWLKQHRLQKLPCKRLSLIIFIKALMFGTLRVVIQTQVFVYVNTLHCSIKSLLAN